MRFWTCQQDDILSESARSSAMRVFTYLASPHYLGYPIQQKLQTNNFVLRVMALEFDFFLMSLSAHFDWNSVEIS